MSRPLTPKDGVVRFHRSPWGHKRCPGVGKPPEAGRPKVPAVPTTMPVSARMAALAAAPSAPTLRQPSPPRPGRGFCPVCNWYGLLTKAGWVRKHKRGHVANRIVCHGTGASPLFRPRIAEVWDGIHERIDAEATPLKQLVQTSPPLKLTEPDAGFSIVSERRLARRRELADQLRKENWARRPEPERRELERQWEEHRQQQERHEMACVGCGTSVGEAAQYYAGQRRKLFACDACWTVIRRFVGTMRSRGYAATDLFNATFEDTPGVEATKALPAATKELPP